MIRKFGDVPDDLSALKPSGSAFQVELRAQSVWRSSRYLAPARILRPIGHDHDFPGVLVCTTEMARSVGHSQMSSISSLIADSSSSRVFAGFFKRSSLPGARNGTTAFGYPLHAQPY
jgi:hypothetical protein